MAHHHAHDHDHGGGHGHSHAHAPRALVTAMVITAIFMGVELAGGWYANSLALVSDGAHMLTDVGALALSLAALWVARRPPSSTMSFGYHRAEILGALASGLAIWAIAGGLIYEAVLRMQSPPSVQGPVVFIVATVGLVANLFCMRALHSAQGESLNVRAAYLHVISDLLGSIGAIIAGAVLWLTGWRPIDPIVTILFSALMLITSWSLVREAIGVLMESSPAGLDPDRVRADLEGLPGVAEVHDLHIWSVSSGRQALSVHLIAAETHGLLAQANSLLQERHRIRHTTIQIEQPSQFRSDRCYDCASP